MIDVVGIGADGLASLAAAQVERLAHASVVVGGKRQLELLGGLPGQLNQQRLTWPSPLRPALRGFLEPLANVVVLASGDPLRSGIATSLIEEFGRENVRVHPHISSDTLARARMGWAAETTDVVTLVGRDITRLTPALTPGARIVVLCSNGKAPAAICEHLDERGWGETSVTAWWNLGAPEEGTRSSPARAWKSEPTPDLVLLCLELPPVGPDPQTLGPAAGRLDDAFVHDGVITKRDVRASALARLRPLPGQLLWDIGAGSGAIGIEWLLAAPNTKAVAIERRPDRLANIRANAEHFGLSHRLTVLEQTVAEALESDDLPNPDAVFLGGGVSERGIDICLRRLNAGGRLVAHAVTLETEQTLLAAWQRYGGHLTRVSIESVQPLGTMTGWTPARSIVQWSVTR